MSDSTVFALALDLVDGVGRVTAGRLLDRFTSLDDLRRYPREQVLTRIKGAPRAEALVHQLFDPSVMDPLLDQARQRLAELHRRRLDVLTPHSAAWPRGIADLPRSQRPFLLYVFGETSVLLHPVVALFARPPLTEAAFEQVLALVHHLVPHGVVPATSAAHGFDVAVQKLCHAGPAAYPGVLVAAAGMAQAPPPLRPTISAAVRTGGLFVSSFPMQHGPFDHDDHERALVQAALAHASLFVAPEPGTPEWRAMTWLLEQSRPVFGLPAPEHPLPEPVHLLRTAVDFDWVLAAARSDA